MWDLSTVICCFFHQPKNYRWWSIHRPGWLSPHPFWYCQLKIIFRQEVLKTFNYLCAFCSIFCFSVDKALLLHVFSLVFSLDQAAASDLSHLSQCILYCWVLGLFWFFLTVDLVLSLFPFTIFWLFYSCHLCTDTYAHFLS